MYCHLLIVHSVYTVRCDRDVCNCERKFTRSCCPSAVCRLKVSGMVLVMRIFDKTELGKASAKTLLATEAGILRQLHHPNVVEVISEQETEARLCQVFELSVVSLWFIFVQLLLSD